MNMEKIYKQVAKIHDVSVEEVKREMQAAINATFDGKGKIPSTEEFIKYALSEIRKSF